MNSKKTIMFLVLILLFASAFCRVSSAAQRKTDYDPKMELIREEAQRAKREAYEKAKAKLEEDLSEIDLPRDTSQRISVKEVRISGNTLLTTDELLEDMPLIFNASTETIKMADSDSLYDLRILHDYIAETDNLKLEIIATDIFDTTDAIVLKPYFQQEAQYAVKKL